MNLQVETSLRAALDRRTDLFSRYEAFRLFDGSGDGMEGLVIDKLGALALVHLYEGVIPVSAVKDPNVVQLLQAEAQCATVYVRQHLADPSESAQKPAELVAGPRCDDVVVSEDGILYHVRPLAQFNAGLFLDTRELRQLLRRRATLKRVLNLFCYTGSLGLAAYCGGAREVVQVDVSRSILKWAKENLALNQVSGRGIMKFFEDDARELLEREHRRLAKGAERYDIIIIDPPPFGRSSKGTFQIKRDLPGLIDGALNVLSPQGELVITANTNQLSADEICALAQQHLRAHGRGNYIARELHAPGADFPANERRSRNVRGGYLVPDVTA